MSLELPLIPLRGVIVFPNSLLSFEIVRSKSIEALETAVENSNLIFLTAQKDNSVEEPELNDIFQTGTVAKVRQVIRMPGNVVRVIVEGTSRGFVHELIHKRPYIKAVVELLEDFDNNSEDIEFAALIRTGKEMFEQFYTLSGKFIPEILIEVENLENGASLSDIIASHININLVEKQKLLEESDVKLRLMEAITLLCKEIKVLEVQKDIYAKVKTKIDKTQREYYLREQIKVINQELGENDAAVIEIESYEARIKKARLPAYAQEKIEKELTRLKNTVSNSPDTNIIRDYLDLTLELPWSKKTKESKDLTKAEAILNRDHYGLEKVKERIIEFLAVRQTADKLNAPVICLVGPPGVGKTSIAKSVAAALNRKFIRMSLGGVRDEAEIRGHRKTYIGAMPGRIISSIKTVGSSNPLILLDEIDKLASDYRGDPASALLEVLDMEQNSTFRDNYLEIPFDLSDCLFICTANNMDTVPSALKDRFEIINISSYTGEEKFNIATKFLVDKQLKKHGLKRRNLKFTAEAISLMISGYTREAGVRQLERYIGDVCRKTVKEFLLNADKKQITITENNLEEYIGKRKFLKDTLNEKPEIGVARGLAWTPSGGDTLQIEVNVMKGTGKFELTGNMGDVMKESAKAAVSYIRSNYEDLKIHKNFYKDSDIHIHIPEGAIPKDGPSAGITMATAMVSALSNIPVKNDIAMTGEITIRGRVLPIGGLKEKSLAARNAGINKVIMPFENQKDLDELPDYLKDSVDFILVKEMHEVLKNALKG